MRAHVLCPIIAIPAPRSRQFYFNIQVRIYTVLPASGSSDGIFNLRDLWRLGLDEQNVATRVLASTVEIHTLNSIAAVRQQPSILSCRADASYQATTLRSGAEPMDIEQRVLETEMNAERVESALQGLVIWLLSKPVLRNAETGAGVVNWLTSDGQWDGLYPEICGYYLRYLAPAAPATGEPLFERSATPSPRPRWSNGTGRDTSFRSAAVRGHRAHQNYTPKAARRDGQVKHKAEDGTRGERRSSRSSICRKAKEVSRSIAPIKIKPPVWNREPR